MTRDFLELPLGNPDVKYMYFSPDMENQKLYQAKGNMIEGRPIYVTYGGG